MKRYKNLSGASEVTGYEFAKDCVTVRFADFSVYKYNVQSVGPDNIVKMKTMAHAGKGLGTFIKTETKDRFARKVR
ncbi:MAG: hypothetical protein HY924_09990 [Elusimicrobia bacterium]|nr:hypothetical protein [Elusimicrobiota bacterium]